MKNEPDPKPLHLFSASESDSGGCAGLWGVGGWRKVYLVPGYTFRRKAGPPSRNLMPAGTPLGLPSWFYGSVATMSSNLSCHFVPYS